MLGKEENLTVTDTSQIHDWINDWIEHDELQYVA
jgi:hypothetical protein